MIWTFYCFGELILSKFSHLFSAFTDIFKNFLGCSLVNAPGCASLFTYRASVELYIFSVVLKMVSVCDPTGKINRRR